MSAARREGGGARAFVTYFSLCSFTVRSISGNLDFSCIGTSSNPYLRTTWKASKKQQFKWKERRTQNACEEGRKGSQHNIITYLDYSSWDIETNHSDLMLLGIVQDLAVMTQLVAPD